MKIGIIGFGFVGEALYANILDKSNVKIYDKFKSHDTLLEVAEHSDIIFVQVPTPSDKEYGVSPQAIKDVLKQLSEFNYTGIVVIKSTILPMAFELPQNLRIVSNPEFLNEVSAVNDFKNQSKILLGGDFKDCHEVEKCYQSQFTVNAKYIYCSFGEAQRFKYLRNIRLAYEVLWTNFMQDTTKNYRKYNELFKEFPVKPLHNFSIMTDGNPGFSGHCLPKDVWAHNFCYKHKLTEFIKDYNTQLKIRD